MKKIKYLLVMALAIFATASLTSCGDNDEPNSGSVDTSKDPEGTVLLNMTAGDYWHGATKIYDGNSSLLYINDDLNWAVISGNSGIVDVGAVKNISAIKSIPQTGWSENCAVRPGHGYILKIKRGKPYYDTWGNYVGETYSYVYYRIYVVSWIEGVSGGILGATVKYQPNWQTEPIN